MDQLAPSSNRPAAATLEPIRLPRAAIEIFSTCPESSRVPPELYRQRVMDVARWSEEAGCRGILVYSDNSLLDPWLVSHLIIQNTTALCPLVAVQPIYMHPYTVAKIAASFGQLYRRRIYLNMIAGGFKNDLVAMNDTTPHDERYDRLVEYTTIIKRLLAGPAPVTFEGKFYRTDKLKLNPPLSADLFPGIFVSGSSDAGMTAARAIRGTAIKYPRPPGEEESVLDCGIECGVRLGIIAREREEDAWEAAYREFPEDRKGQITRELATKVSDSLWHKQLADLEASERSPYWLVPFQNYKTMCPYLVGSYSGVARELARYILSGYSKFILDIPHSAEELQHSRLAFDRAVMVAS